MFVYKLFIMGYPSNFKNSGYLSVASRCYLAIKILTSMNNQGLWLSTKGFPYIPVHLIFFRGKNIPGVTKLRFTSHMRHEGLSVALDKCTRIPFSFLCYYVLLSFRMCFKMSFKLLRTNMKD